MNNEQSISRRAFFRRGGTVGLAVLGIAAGCGGGGEELSCDDTTGLTPAELSARQSNGYVANSPHGATKNCLGCNFGQNLAPESCGACQVIKGQIHPNGYCNLWVVKAG